jgi:hypothetical protein
MDLLFHEASGVRILSELVNARLELTDKSRALICDHISLSFWERVGVRAYRGVPPIDILSWNATRHSRGTNKK